MALMIQVIKMIDNGYRLPPLPGLTKELYKIMIQCWYVQNVPSIRYHVLKANHDYFLAL